MQWSKLKHTIGSRFADSVKGSEGIVRSGSLCAWTVFIKLLTVLLLLMNAYKTFSQSFQSIRVTDSICDEIDKGGKNFIRIRVKLIDSRGKSWEHYLADTVNKEYYRVVTRLDKSPKSYWFYIVNDHVIRVNVRTKITSGRMNIECYYFQDNRIIFPKNKTSLNREFKKRLKKFLDYKRTTIFSG